MHGELPQSGPPLFEGEPAPELLDRYLTGECSAESAAFVRRWVAQSPAHAAWMDELREIVGVVANTPAWDTGAAWWRLQRALGQDGVDDRSTQLAPVAARVGDARVGETPAGDVPRVFAPSLAMDQDRGYSRSSSWGKLGGAMPSPRGMFWRRSVAMASLATTAAVAFVLVRYAQTRTGENASAVAATTYNTGNGQRANIVLPDGSRVVLNVASTLQVPADYAEGNHTLRLTGEAFFTVQHRSGTPFTVHAGNSTTRVLGTSFVVRSYPTDTMATIVVRDGKVAVHSRVLDASQQVEVGAHGVSAVHSADPSRFTFVTGTLTFNGTPLRDAIPELARWYDADIRLGDDAIAGRRIVAEFSSESLSDLTAILQTSFDNLRVVRDGRVITLYSK